eukprot:scaffold871_cov130-Cylindrotheca_fusiformis.AAC.21
MEDNGLSSDANMLNTCLIEEIQIFRSTASACGQTSTRTDQCLVLISKVARSTPIASCNLDSLVTNHSGGIPARSNE